MGAALRELNELLTQEVRLLAVGPYSDLQALHLRKLELIQALFKVQLDSAAREELRVAWLQNRHLLSTLKNFIPDRVPNAASQRQEGWRG